MTSTDSFRYCDLYVCMTFVSWGNNVITTSWCVESLTLEIPTSLLSRRWILCPASTQVQFWNFLLDPYLLLSKALLVPSLCLHHYSPLVVLHISQDSYNWGHYLVDSVIEPEMPVCVLWQGWIKFKRRLPVLNMHYSTSILQCSCAYNISHLFM